MTDNRLRGGALAWLLTLQFFVVEAIAAGRYEGPYSRGDDVISDLGAAASPAASTMNASFAVQGVLIAAGAWLLRPALLRGAGEVAPVLLGGAGAGVLLVGVFPSDGNATMHAIGAVLYLLGGGLGLIALAYAVRPRSELLGTALALLGLLGTAATVFFLTGVVSYLGEGGTERLAAYVLPIGLALAGVVLWRLGSTAAAPDGADRHTRREERERDRAARSERERQRDEALEAAARRKAAGTAGTAADSDGTDGAEDDPWAAPGRRRD